MAQNSARISDLWKKEYSAQINKYSEYKATDQFQQIAALFSPGRSYFYILNMHNLELDYISPDVEKFIGLSPDEVSMDDLLKLALPEEIEVLEKKEVVIKDFFSRYLKPHELTSYKVVYSYKMRDHLGEILTILHQATPISVAENGSPQHILSIHSDISHLRVCSTKEVSFINIKEGRSFYNMETERGIFQPGLQDEKTENLYEAITDREKEIVRLLAKGLSAEEIAEDLFLSVHTITTHRKNILKKSGCKNTAQLVAKCLTGGIVSHQHL